MTNKNSLAVALLPLGGSGLPTICDQNSLTPLMHYIHHYRHHHHHHNHRHHHHYQSLPPIWISNYLWLKFFREEKLFARIKPTSPANKQPLLSNQYDYDEYEIIHIDDNDDRDNNDHENMVGLSISINSRHSLFIG